MMSLSSSSKCNFEKSSEWAERLPLPPGTTSPTCSVETTALSIASFVLDTSASTMLLLSDVAALTKEEGDPILQISHGQERAVDDGLLTGCPVHKSQRRGG